MVHPVASLRAAPRFLLQEMTRPWAPPAGSRIVAAVSGGCDSVAMLHLLAGLAPGRGWDLVVATLDHGLRGEEGAEDARFVAREARRLGLPCVAGAARTPAGSGSLEEAARRVRLAFLRSVAQRERAAAVALAHTLDDQAETVLMRLTRGCGARGAAAMARRRGDLWRPLLGVRREALREFARRAGLEWREDPTNRDPAATRNRVRMEVLPAIERALGPGAIRALARSAELAREEEEALDRWARDCLQEVVLERGPGAIVLDRRRLGSLPEAVARRVLLEAAASVGGARARLTAAHARALLALARAESSGSRADLPNGLRARRTGAGLRIEASAGPAAAAGPG
ncbi:MAG: tRNA lysidine(34) synthetase TilS [Acidobacteria bacterium]|nr:MAG: tRNA lysidine(34) synthetase TilS [Acidobacteriota bacterium]